MEYELYHWGIKGMKWGVRRYQNKNGSLTPAGKKRYSEVHEDYAKAHSGKSVKSMSNKELQDVNNRLNMERQYATLTKKTSKGKKAVQSLIATAGTIAAAEGAYKTYKRLADGAINGLSNYVMADLAKGLSKGF